MRLKTSIWYLSKSQDMRIRCNHKYILLLIVLSTNLSLMTGCIVSKIPEPQEVRKIVEIIAKESGKLKALIVNQPEIKPRPLVPPKITESDVKQVLDKLPERELEETYEKVGEEAEIKTVEANPGADEAVVVRTEADKAIEQTKQTLVEITENVYKDTQRAVFNEANELAKYKQQRKVIESLLRQKAQAVAKKSVEQSRQQGLVFPNPTVVAFLVRTVVDMTVMEVLSQYDSD